MPRTQSAKKKVRIDLKRRRINRWRIRLLRQAIKNARDEASLRLAFKQIDKTTKRGIIHRRKAARLKSRLASALAQQAESSTK